MDVILTQISRFLTGQTWQVAVLFVLVAAACWILRKTSAHWRYLLWLVVLVKCLVPPVLTVPVAILPEAPASAIAPQVLPVAAPQESKTLPPTDHEPAAISEQTSLLPPAPATIFAALTTPQWLAAGWMAGTIAFLPFALIRACWAHSRFRRLRHPIDPVLRDEIAGLAGHLRLRRAPEAWLIQGIAQPFVWGLVRGSIYLPADFAATGTAEDRRGILMHELAHVARFDAAINLLQTLAQALFFFHPLVWWANARLRQEREKCCDEIAIASLGTAPRQYSTAIVDTLVREYAETQPLPTLAVAGPVRNLEDRIKTIMAPNRRFYARPSYVAVVTAILLAALVVPTALVLTAREDTKSKLKQTNSEDRRIDQGPIAAALRKDKTVSPVKNPQNQIHHGSKLSFRVVPTGLTPEEIRKHAKDLQENGPGAGCRRGDEYQWFEIKSEVHGGIYGAYGGHRYILLHAWPPYVMIPQSEGPEAWGPKAVYPTKDANGKPAVMVELGDRGARLLSELTGRSLGRPLAILIDGKVVSAPVIRSPLSRQAIIVGRFTDEEVARLAKALREGMVPSESQNHRPAGQTPPSTTRPTAAEPNGRLTGNTPETRTDEALAHPEIIRKAAQHLFDLIRSADYDKVLRGEDWRSFPTIGYYETYTDYPSFARWISRTFKQNPIQAVELGKVYTNQDGLPTLSYALTLKSGRIIRGELPFGYDLADGRWYGKWGLDWHLHDPFVSLDERRHSTSQPQAERPSSPTTDPAIHVYPVNRKISDFPPPDNFSTPEAAYAAINRVSAAGDPAGWRRVSVKELADRLGREDRQGKMAVPPEWAKVLLNARVLEVCIWKDTVAAVMAELPQQFSSQPIRSPIDVRHLKRENGLWLNTGNDRVDSMEEGEALFKRAIKRTMQ